MVMAGKTRIGMWLCGIIAMAVLLAFASGVEESHANTCDVVDHPYDRYKEYSAIVL